MKKISVLIPCFNEVENVEPMAEAVAAIMTNELSRYDYEIVFCDNYSTDGTRDALRAICQNGSKVKAILNVSNFGQFNSPFHAIQQLDSDCVVQMCCDFQDPIEMIPRFVEEWEKGYTVVCGIKVASDESKTLRFLRTCYYRLIDKTSNIKQIEHFSGFGLYDKSFIELLRQIHDPTPFLRGLVAEYAANRKDLPYKQAKRKAGKSHNNWYSLYDGAMVSFTSYTKVGLRLATIIGAFSAVLCIVVALAYAVLKIFNWFDYPAGIIPILLTVVLLGSIQLFFLGVLGEYILGINTRIMNRPLVIEEERLNF